MRSWRAPERTHSDARADHVNREHLETILWLRWRLSRNQWARSSGLGAAILVFLVVGGVLIGLGMFVGALLSSGFGLAHVEPMVLVAIWAGITGLFLFMWLIGMMAELQR